MTEEVTWKEHQIHTTEQQLYKKELQPEEEEEEATGFELFATNELKVFELEFPGLPKLTVKGQSECTQSTGLGLWVGGDVIIDYLLRDSSFIRHKRVLELRAGVGLCGLVAYHLGASQVILTDGDTSVLENLRFNISQNITEKETKQDTSDSISCAQLIWGRDATAFLERYPKPQVMIATDCLYIQASVEPFWRTVDQLLEPDGVLLYTMVSASTAPHEMVLEVAKGHGFSCQEMAKDVYLFQRS